MVEASHAMSSLSGTGVGNVHNQIEEPTIKITVNIRDQNYQVFCGAGTQKIRWLSDVAIHRY